MIHRQFWHAFFVALPDLSASMEDLVTAGDRVAGRFVYRGTRTGDFMGIPASGNAVEMRSSTSGASRVAYSPSTGTS